MPILSQNKKIAVSALAVFVVSFTSMMFFLDSGAGVNHTQANVLHMESEVGLGYEKYDALDMPIFVTNGEGKLEYINQEFCNLVRGACSNQGEGKIYDYVKESDHAELASMYAKLIQGGLKIEGMGPVVVSNGRKNEKLILLTGEPILDKKDKVQAIIFTAKDLTKQVQALQ